MLNGTFSILSHGQFSVLCLWVLSSISLMITLHLLILVLIALEDYYSFTKLVARKLSTNRAKILIIVVSSNSDNDFWCDLGNYDSVGRKFYGWSLACFEILTLLLFMLLDEEDSTVLSFSNVNFYKHVEWGREVS